eukprot:TRINITY_DN123814_c0_g1_i1.p1 TRINITY_DN123814_c0_g1~~TRINITY_DN123814_c0_g1_i1.p1  ORF type:complete len:326 (-),score=76.53 TRINITY_DN123814_c0_g1_i1:74-1051(-)
MGQCCATAEGVVASKPSSTRLPDKRATRGSPQSQSTMATSSPSATSSSPAYDSEEDEEEAEDCLTSEAQEAAMKRKLQEIECLLAEMKAPEDPVVAAGGKVTVSGPSRHAVVRFGEDRGEIEVIVGTSEHAQMAGLIERISSMVAAAYSGKKKHKRLGRHDVVHRLQMGDAGAQANRVLHLAFKAGELVGCASSTFQPGWTDEGMGHWGLLAVDPAHQGAGVATALVLAAERRLATACDSIQIEYEHTEGEEFSARLEAWYEGKLGFHCSRGGRRQRGVTTFRCCHKAIQEVEQDRGKRRRLEDIQDWLQQKLAQSDRSANAFGA